MKKLLGMVLVGAIIVGAVVVRVSNRKERFTVINIKNGVSVESFDPVTLSGIKLIIPDRLEVETVGGRGKWQAGVLEKAANKFGVKWATDSVADYLGISYTNGVKDWQWWWWERKGSWKTVNLEKTRWVREIEAIDGTKLLALASDWEGKAGEWFAQSNIVNEGLNVTVENTSGIEGLGTHAARVLESGGMKVRMIRSAAYEVGECEVVTNLQTRQTVGAGWLTRVFGCKWMESQEETGEVILKLGKNYRAWWLGLPAGKQGP